MTSEKQSAGLLALVRENLRVRLAEWQQRPAWGKLVALAALAFFLGLTPASVFWPYQGYRRQAVVIVEQGMGRRAIADRLAARGVLYSRWPFLFYAYFYAGHTLKAGEYLFDRPRSPASVFHQLERGEVRVYALTIPEGWTHWEIADEVARRNLANRDAFLRATENPELIRSLAPEAASLEGYLFPDTYYFARPSSPEQMVSTMVERFRRVYSGLRQAASERASEGTNPQNLTPHQLVTLASLVEKETGAAGERGLIASVFTNRLRRRFLLACDPTVIYAARLAAGGEFDGIIHQSDLDRKSPYNTYLHVGLPPGPIASPGRAALAAALNPPQSDYFYFVSNTQGGHFFARTFTEHDRNVARYRRLRRQQ